MNFSLNGEAYSLPEGSTLSDLAKNLDLEGKRYAIEVNEDIISRSEHAQHIIQCNDNVEVVVAIGGG